MKLVFFPLLFLIAVSCNQEEKRSRDASVKSQNIVPPKNVKISIKEPGVKECNIELNLNKVEQGCEGEACLCSVINTVSPKSVSDLDVYEKPDLKSKVISKLKEGEKIKSATPYMIKRRLGIGAVVKGAYSEDGKYTHIETGEKLFIIQYEGENYYNLCDGEKEKSSDMIKVIRESAIEKWLNIILNDGQSGWTKGHWGFQFNEGCG